MEKFNSKNYPGKVATKCSYSFSQAQALRLVDDAFLIGGRYANLVRSMSLEDLQCLLIRKAEVMTIREVEHNRLIDYLFVFVGVFFISLSGARRPLAREPFDVNPNDDITDTKFSIDFSAISE